MNLSSKLADSLIRVFVADSSRIHTQLLAAALRSEESFEVTECIASSQGIVADAIKNSPDVAIVSTTQSDNANRGFDLVREMRAGNPGLRVLMLLDSATREVVLEAFRCGAKGIFSRSESLETLRKCIICVHNGEIWASAEQMAYAVEALASAPVIRAIDSKGLSLLSKRELEIVQCLAEGLTNREIAQRIGLSQHTVKNYLFKVFDKLGVTSRVELLFMTMSQAGSPRANSSSPVESHSGNGLAMYQKAAEEGFPSAQFMLAQMFHQGRGVPKDPVMAYMWYLVCEISTDELKDESLDQRQALSKLLNSDQLADAQSRAKQYIKRLAKAAIVQELQAGLTQFVASLLCVLMMAVCRPV
jgi:two-component system nitrate/nitrite response regulator NarL